MSVPRLSPEQRLNSIFQAALEIVAESGINAVTLVSIANRSGVSRQWLHRFFPDLDALYIALFHHIRASHQIVERTPPTDPEELAAFLKDLMFELFDLPVAYCIIGSFAINGNAGSAKSRENVRRLVLDSFQQRWVEPLAALGYRWEDSLAEILTLQGAAYTLAIALDSGLIDRLAAEDTLSKVVDAIVLTRTLREVDTFDRSKTTRDIV